MDPSVHWASLSMIIFATIPAIAFPVRWAVRSQWRRNYVGRGLMYQAVSIAVIMLYVLFLNLDPDFPYRDYLRVLIFFLIGAMQWVLFWVLHTVRKETPEHNSQNRRIDDIPPREHHGRRPPHS